MCASTGFSIRARIKPIDYFKHLLRYFDAHRKYRFAADIRFRYFAFNSVQRWRALSISRAFVRRTDGAESLTLRQLEDALVNDNTELLQRVVRGQLPSWAAAESAADR